MPIPQSITDLNTNPNNNSPQGSEAVGPNANGYIQTLSAFIRQLYDSKVGKGTLDAPKGTRLVLQQASAPTGWTVDTADWLTDCAMRFSPGGNHGGVTAWSAWNFGGTFTTDGRALTPAQMPVHGHGVNDPGHGHQVNDPGHAHGANAWVSDPGHAHGMQKGASDTGAGSFVNSDSRNDAPPGATEVGYTGISVGVSVHGSGTGIWVSGSGTGISIQNSGSGQAHDHTYKTPQVKYADCIVAVKS
ncbi:hypothetical protein K7G19_19905 [Cupriavidus sp. DB3]|uniref:hypothetical protein n=1 Tax=Cupriavidus sp. DB3 TaxID=2873259 RepID=UPI001CF41DE7|nr:hypothetical protein [Cupriavidus sp. DB3]MCA7085857.1 hypothetical protein [Cupriavidus sp. DB3]